MLPARSCTPSRARKSSSAPPPRKQTSWLSRAVAAARPAAAASARTAAFVAAPRGRRRRASSVRRDAREHVRLVLRLVGASSDERAAAALDEARVVTGRYLPSPETLGDCDQCRQTVGAVAGRAGIRGLTARVAGHERLDHGTAKGLASVERDVWQPEGVAALTGAQHGRGRAACALGIGCLLVDPQPEGEADDVAAPRSLAQQRDRGIHSARHRDRDPPRRSHQRERPLRHASEGGVQRVERHRGAIPCSSA